MKHLLQCPACFAYTLKETCPKCQTKTAPPKPPKFSLLDKYGQYRREQKKPEFREKGWY